MKLRNYWLFMLALLVVDWGWGMAQVRGMVPLWSFVLLNFPFGLPYSLVSKICGLIPAPEAGLTCDTRLFP